MSRFVAAFFLALGPLLTTAQVRAESFRFEFANLITQKMESIQVKVTLPRVRAPERPALIYLTGCDGSIQDSTRPIFDALLRQGYVIAHVESLGTWSRRANACTGAPGALTGAQHAEDAYRARDGLVERGWVAADNVAVLGYSHGGWAISHAMFLDPTPSYDTRGKPAFAAAVAFYPWCQTNDSPTFVNRTPTLMLGGDRDEWTHFSRCRQLARAVRAANLASYPPLTLRAALHSRYAAITRLKFNGGCSPGTHAGAAWLDRWQRAVRRPSLACH